MTDSVLHYVHDPLCGWCYAAGPMVAAVAEAGIPVVLHGGGLWETAAGIDPGKRAYIRQADARIADLTGVTFGGAYLDGLLADPAALFWSRPTIAAILAAGAVGPGAELPMLRAVQHAHYVEGRRVVETPVLAAAARSIGLDAEAFGRALADAPVDEHVAATRRLMGRAGLRGFPGFLVERGGGPVRVGHEPFYGRPADFLRAVEAAGAAAPAA